MLVKRIGVLTSGGDAPGMNAAIAAVVKCAAVNGIEVVGVVRGYNGLMNENFKVLDVLDVMGVVKRGGTMLFSARCLEFKTLEGTKQASDVCKRNNIDGLIVIGGDGSFSGAARLSKYGVLCVGIPGTIDKDIACTEYTIGFDTAVNTAVSMVDRLCDTVASHDRCSVVEVMGRSSGYIALDVGLCCGADYVVVPEFEFKKEDLFNKIKVSVKNGKKHFIIVVAEGLLNVFDLAKEIEKSTGVESRATVLGHVQRGGSPTAKDRIAAARLGWHAVDLLKNGRSSRVVCLKNDEVVDLDITEALEQEKKFPEELYRRVQSLA